MGMQTEVGGGGEERRRKGVIGEAMGVGWRWRVVMPILCTFISVQLRNMKTVPVGEQS